MKLSTDAYSETSQKSKMELLAKIVNDKYISM